MTWSWRDLDAIQATPGDMRHSLQAMRSTHIPVSEHQLTLKFLCGSEMTKCTTVNAHKDHATGHQTGSDNSRAVICAGLEIATSLIHNDTSFAWMPL